MSESDWLRAHEAWSKRALAAEADADRLRTAFLRFVQQDNACQAHTTGSPCRSHKCGCALEMQSYIDETSASVGGSVDPK